jgi:hypothetical protein
VGYSRAVFAARRPWLWAIVAVLLGWGFVVASRGKAALPPPSEGGSSDLKMYSAVTARVAAGENYYRVLAEELPSRGYAIRPVFNWRLPTLTWVNAIPPTRFWGRTVLVLMGSATTIFWLLAIRASLPRALAISIPVLLFAVPPVAFLGASVVFYEVWAGLFIAASLACSGLGRWKTSVALGAAAVLIRELALPYLLIMAAVAWWESKSREAIAWTSAVAIFLIFWAWHVSQVLKVMPPTGLVNTWMVAGGWGFVMEASLSSVFFLLVPSRWEQWTVAAVMPLLWAGSWYWSDNLGRRVALILTGYFALFMVVGRPDNWYWGFVIAPLIPLSGLGYMFGPRATRKT